MPEWRSTARVDLTQDEVSQLLNLILRPLWGEDSKQAEIARNLLPKLERAEAQFPKARAS